MGSNSSQRLNAYARYDGSGRVVAGSLVLRRSKPKVGNWQPVQGYLCCNFEQVPVTVNIQSSFPISQPDFVLQGVGGNDQYMFVYAGGSVVVANIAELVAYNNSAFGYLGTFTDRGAFMEFAPNAATAAIFVGSGATSIEAYQFAD
jgi:hypothetical protein